MMKPDEQRRFEERIRSLRGGYMKTLEERAMRIESFLKQEGSPVRSPVTLEQIKFDVHKIAGTAGSFSLNALGDASARANRMIHEGAHASEDLRRVLCEVACELDKARYSA